MRLGGRMRDISPIAWIIALAALVKFLIHMLTGANYGFFFDELYTIALSKHLDFGYIDLPPLVPLLVAASRFVFGESLIAYHIVPAFAGALTLVFACLITKEFGGKQFAVGLTALGFITSPAWLGMDSIFCYDGIDQLVLTIFLFLLARFLRTGNKKLWPAIGIAAGIALLTKATILFLGPGFLIGLLATKYRRQLLTPWPWIALGVFIAIASPYVVWNYANKWTTIHYWMSYGSQRVYRYSFPEYLVNIAINMGFTLMPLVAAGLFRILRRFSETSHRFFGILFVATFALVFLFRTRAIILAELCIPLIAAAAVWIEALLRESGWKWVMRIAAVSVLLAGGIIAAPIVLPLLPISSLPAYAKAFGFLYKDLKDFKFSSGEYPIMLSGRIGWDDMVKAVAAVYDSLPADDRAKVGILANWYGPAGAIDLLGKRYGLPNAVTGHLNYYQWGPGKGSWDVMIVVTSTPEGVPMFFSDAKLAATSTSALSGSFTTFSILVCRSPNAPKEVLWPATLIY